MSKFSTLNNVLSFGYVKFSFKDINGLCFDFYHKYVKKKGDVPFTNSNWSILSNEIIKDKALIL